MSNELEQVFLCPNCKGKGWMPAGTSSTAFQECPVCETRGLLVVDSGKTMRRKRRPAPCNYCLGEGTVGPAKSADGDWLDQPCPKCAGGVRT